MQYKNNEVECLFGQLLKISDVYLLIIFIYIYRDFHILHKIISQCREQEGSATLVIVTLHLWSTLPIQSERYSSYVILFAALRYDVGLFCQNVLSFTVQTPHSCSSFSFSSVLTTVLTFRMRQRNVSKRKIAQCSLQQYCRGYSFSACTYYKIYGI